MRTAIKYVQGDEGAFKKIVLENLNEYIAQDDGSLATLFDRMHENEVKIFLLTNSEYDFTNVRSFVYLFLLGLVMNYFKIITESDELFVGKFRS